MARVWDDVLPAADRVVFAGGGYGQQAPLGRRPVLLIIDVTYNFTGDRPEPILESIRRYPASCGAVAWQCLPAIAGLAQAARERQVPVLYTRGPLRKTALTLGGWARTNSRQVPLPEGDDPGETIPAPVAPQAGDVVLEKLKPSAFFGTPLVATLTEMGADTLLVCGTSTSGCVRATVVDAFSYGYRVAVVEDGTFDRGILSHKASLFDMHQKYAGVISLAEALAYLSALSL